MLDREHKRVCVQNDPGLCRPWLVFGLILTTHHVRAGSQADAFPVRRKVDSVREEVRVQRGRK